MSGDTIYTYTWTPKEGRALLRALEAYLSGQRHRKRRWRARQLTRGELIEALTRTQEKVFRLRQRGRKH